MAPRSTRLVFAVVVVCAAILSMVDAQAHVFSRCPSVEPIQDLDMEKLSQGSWYELKATWLRGYRETKPWCPKTTFGPDLSVTTEFFSPYGDTPVRQSLRGHLKKTGTNGSFNITYDNIVTSGEIPYNFISAEYDDFVIIFACYKFERATAVSSWMLSRTPQPTRNAYNKFEEKFESMGISFPGVLVSETNRDEDCEENFEKYPAAETTTTEGTTTVVPPLTSSESTPGTEATPSPRTETTLQKEPTTTSGTPVYSSPNADQSTTTQASAQSTIKLVYAGEGQPGQGENWGYIQSLLAAQWGMLVALLLLGLFVVMSALAVYRMLLPFLRARQHDETRTLVFAPSDSKEKKTGHYNDGLEVDV